MIYAFVHIEKCGGTTLIESLRRDFPFRHVDLIPIDRDKNFVQTSDIRRALSVYPYCVSMAGHSIRVFCDLGEYSEKIKFYSLVRDPIDRYISDYMHDLRRGYSGSLSDWTKYDDRANYITKSLCGSDDIHVAKQTIKERYEFIGLLEEYDSFYSAVSSALDGRLFGYKISNQAETPKTKHGDGVYVKPVFSDSDRELVRKINSVDIELYNWIKSENKDIDREIGVLPYKEGALKKLAYRVYRNAIYKTSVGRSPLDIHALPRNGVNSKVYYEKNEGVGLFD